MTVVEANGARIPAIGLGTMTLKEQVCIDAIKAALRLGYRHLDTAERYGNEEWVGEGLRQGLAASALNREDVFVRYTCRSNGVACETLFIPYAQHAFDFVVGGFSDQILEAEMLKFLAACVQSKTTILISGGTGSGKTTTLNALSRFIP